MSLIESAAIEGPETAVDVISQHRDGDEHNPGALEYQEQENQTGRRGAGKRACVILGSAILQMPIWGFAMSYGIFQEYYTSPSNWTLHGSQATTGVIGTTSNGVMYLSMPVLFFLFTRLLAPYRRMASLSGTIIAVLAFLLSSFSTDVWHLVAAQGVLAALGCALVYSAATLSLGEWFNGDPGNRALAYGFVLSCKNIVGSACPFLFRMLLDSYGFRITLRIWAGILGVMSVMGILLVPAHPITLAPDHRPSDGGAASSDSPIRRRLRSVPWHFARHPTFYIYAVAIALQSSGYSIPQTYLNTYAHNVSLLSQATATLLLTLFNIPGIFASAAFGYLSDSQKRFPMSASNMTALSAVSSAISVFLFWGLASPSSQGNSMALLVVFSITFGFFAGGYSATWGGIVSEMEHEAARNNEAIDPGLVYGLLNGARGLGYVSGGLAGVPLLNAKPVPAADGPSKFAYGSQYGPLIIFTGLSSMMGGWGLLWKWGKLL